jgi:hypothetical protein
VVQHAQGKPVVLPVGAARLVPADVGGVQGDGHRPEPDVEPADGTAVLVRDQHPLAERRVPLPGLRRRRPQAKAQRLEDVGVEGLREVALQQAGDAASLPDIVAVAQVVAQDQDDVRQPRRGLSDPQGRDGDGRQDDGDDGGRTDHQRALPEGDASPGGAAGDGGWAARN